MGWDSGPSHTQRGIDLPGRRRGGAQLIAQRAGPAPTSAPPPANANARVRARARTRNRTRVRTLIRRAESPRAAQAACGISDSEGGAGGSWRGGLVGGTHPGRRRSAAIPECPAAVAFAESGFKRVLVQRNGLGGAREVRAGGTGIRAPGAASSRLRDPPQEPLLGLLVNPVDTCS
jgi:hypothetical protein